MISIELSPLMLASEAGTPTACIRDVVEDIREDGSIIEDKANCAIIREQLFAVGKPTSASFEPSWRPIPFVTRSQLNELYKKQQEEIAIKSQLEENKSE